MPLLGRDREPPMAGDHIRSCPAHRCSEQPRAPPTTRWRRARGASRAPRPESTATAARLPRRGRRSNPSAAGSPPRLRPTRTASASRSSCSSHHAERGDLFLLGGGQPLQREACLATMASSRFAASLKPNVAYLSLNFSALRKKQTTCRPWHKRIPYQVLGDRPGALSVMTAWSRPPWRDPALPSRRSSRARRFPHPPYRPPSASLLIAARSSSVNPLDPLPLVLLADFGVFVLAGFLLAIANQFLLLDLCHG